MLLIRREQMDAFVANKIQKFESTMVQHLRSAFPAYCTSLDNRALRRLIRLGVTKAEEYRIEMEWDVRRFIECCVLYGPNFDEDLETIPAGDILRDETLGGREKMDRIEQLDLK